MCVRSWEEVDTSLMTGSVLYPLSKTGFLYRCLSYICDKWRFFIANKSNALLFPAWNIVYFSLTGLFIYIVSPSGAAPKCSYKRKRYITFNNLENETFVYLYNVYMLWPTLTKKQTSPTETWREERCCTTHAVFFFNRWCLGSVVQKHNDSNH